MNENIPVSLLLIEPDTENQQKYNELIAAISRQAYTIQNAASLLEAKEIYTKTPPTCILLGSSIEIQAGLNWINEQLLASDFFQKPIVFLNQTPEDETANQAEKQGRIVILSEPYLTSEGLFYSIQRAIEKTKLQNHIQSLQITSVFDPVTQLLSRLSILEMFKKDLARAQRTGRVLGIGLCEINNFDELIKKHGPEAGNEMLKELGRYIMGAIRTTDSCGRYSNSTFLIILPGFDYSCATFERIRRATMGSLIHINDETINIETNVAAIFCRGSESIDMIMQQAERALKEAQSSGQKGVILAAHPNVKKMP